MIEQLTREYACDLCGSDAAEEIAVTRAYTGGPPIHVCTGCGLVYVRERRPSRVIADDWSDKLFENHFTARVPYMKARHVFLAEVLDTTIRLQGKDVCDIGAGEGVFLDVVRQEPYGARVFGVEPSAKNGELLTSKGIDHFVGTIEEFAASSESATRRFDVVTVMWTLETCQDPRAMLSAAHKMLKPGGHLLVATGSRILVPFKKPLYYYIGPSSKVALDTHVFRFSANTLKGLLATSGFRTTFVNRYLDHDVLCVVAQKVDGAEKIDWEKDDYRAVIDYFERWDADTRTYFPAAGN